MNAHERIMKALSHEEPDRVPTTSQSIEQPFIRQFNQEIPWFKKFTMGLSGHYDLEVARALGYDSKWYHTGRTSANWREKPVIPPELQPKANQNVGSAGIKTEKNSSGGSWYVDGVLKTPELMKEWISYIKTFTPGNPEFYTRWAKTVWQKYIAKDFVPIPTAGGPFYTTWASIGMDRLGYFMRKHPGLLSELINAWVNHTIDQHTLFFEQGVDMMYICDDHAFKGASMISPKQWDQFLLEPYQRLCANGHKYGAKMLFHSDGDLTEIIPNLINAGFDAIEPCEYEAGMRLGPLKEKFGDKIAFIGNVAASDVLCFGSKEDTIKATKQVISDAATGGGLVLSAGANILGRAKVENVRTMVETTKKYGVYPINKINMK